MSVNVLVVDDSDVIRNMILKTLRLAEVPLGSAYEAGNGREALSILRDNWVDVVIADINMPVMDGVEMLKHIRASDDLHDLPVIVISTEGAVTRVSELAAVGVSAYVRKPFTPEKIRDVMDSITQDLEDVPCEDVVDQLQLTFSNVLEQFALVYGAPAGSELPALSAEDGEVLQAHMTFSGRERGAMTLMAPFSLCREMAANALGVDVEDSRAGESAADVLGEVLNMTCGLLVMAREPDRPTDLAPPAVVAVGREEWHGVAADEGTVSFDVEGRPALLQCVLRPSR